MQPRPDFSRKLESPPNTNSPHGIELIGVKQNFGFNAFRSDIVSEPVGRHAMNHFPSQFIGGSSVHQNFFRKARAYFRMTFFAVDPVTLVPADIV